MTSENSDKRELLAALAIDRATGFVTHLSASRRWSVAALAGTAVVVLVVILLVVWRDTGLPVTQVEAPPSLPVPATPDPGIVPAASVLDATGYVVARRQATVSAKVTGKVVEVFVEEGMHVTEGQLLARLDASVPLAELELAQARLALAQAASTELAVNRKQARLDLGRTTELASRQLASQADLDRDRLQVDSIEVRQVRARLEVEVARRGLEVQRRLLADMEIRAPFTGVVVAKAAQPGEMVSPISAGGGFTRTGICSIVDMDSLEVEVEVNEAYINRVRPAQPVTVRLNAYPDYLMPAEVIAIIPTADRNRATVRVRISLLEPDSRVLPDMGVRVAFLELNTRSN
jgi:HlyD family secretion protein